MSPPIEFRVDGLPKPAGSKRGFIVKGRVIITDDCKKSRDWKTDVQHAAREVYQGTPLDGPLFVCFTFDLVRPKRHYRTGKNAALLREGCPEYPTVMPDVLKLARAVEDALTGIIWRDDALIVTEMLKKRYSERPGVNIYIREESL